MKKALLALVVLASAAVLGLSAAQTPGASYPRPVYGTLLSAAETEQLLDAAVKHSPYRKPWFKRPVVDLVPTKKWQEEACGNASIDCGVLGYTALEERDIVHVVATIPAEAVNRLGWTREEIIVHELVHWLQLQTNRARFASPSCASSDAIETEAYNAQFQYAVQELHSDHGFWKPDIYAECVIMSRGHHANQR
jgi:hypothetical protein